MLCVGYVRGGREGRICCMGANGRILVPFPPPSMGTAHALLLSYFPN